MKTKSNKKGQLSGPVSAIPSDLMGKLNAPALPAWTPERKAILSKSNKKAFLKDATRLRKIMKANNLRMRGVPKHGGTRSAEDIAKIKEALNKPECKRKRSIGMKAVWKNWSKETKEKISKAAQTKEVKAKRKATRIKNGYDRDPKIYKEIYDQCWGADRGAKLYKKLSKKYGMTFNVIKGTACGHHSDPKQYKKDLKQWHSIYGILYKIIDPKGKELKFKSITLARAYAKQDVFGHFNCSKPKQRGKFKGWRFIKCQRKDQ